VIFVIDNSGSMGGTSIAQAKAGLLYALGRLQPNDRFNVIRFDNTMGVLFPDVVPADSDHLAQAKAFVTALQAEGGTEMIPPMHAALTDHLADGNTVRQVVFLTDGCIGNEQQLFDTITSMRGRSRVFMVGIGSAPNSFLMTRAAELGRGTFTHIGSVEQVESRMRELFGKLESPAVTQLSVTFSDTKANMDAGRAARPLSLRTAGSGGQARQARRHDGNQGPYRRSALERHAAARQRGRGQRTLKALGAAQDRGRGSRAKGAHPDDR
jgi:Ca-activated chloride channel homolog